MERRTDAEAGKALLGNRCVDDALTAELVQQALADFVRALILGDFLAHQEHVLVVAHFFGHGIAERFAHRHRLHRAIVFRLGRWRRINGFGWFFIGFFVAVFIVFVVFFFCDFLFIVVAIVFAFGGTACVGRFEIVHRRLVITLFE